MLRNMATIYILYHDKMLMLYRIGSRVVNPPSWCGIGGHFEKEELNDPKACILRELNEETGMTEGDISDLRLRYVTLRLKNDEIRQNYYFFARYNHDSIKEYFCDEGVLEWVDINEVLNREMPFSAKYCLEHYLSVGKSNKHIYTGAAAKNGVNFVELSEF
jgi:8-oxo-dGTP diphosphatase